MLFNKYQTFKIIIKAEFSYMNVHDFIYQKYIQQKNLNTMRNVTKLTLPHFNHKPRPYTGPSYEEVKALRDKHMPAGMYFHFYKQPLFIVEGKDQYLYDHKGNRYIDLIAGISTVSIGHAHQGIAKLIADQANKLTHTTPIYLTEFQGKYSKALSDELGPEYDQVFLCNSGSEANDMAILLARLFTGNHKFFSLRNGYHGLVGNSKSVTNVGTWNTNFNNTQEFEKLAWTSQYRGALKTTELLLKDAEEAFQSNAIHGKIAGMIFEPIQGVGGINPVPQGYGPGIAALVKKYGGLIIADEVQTGFGRVGEKFWGHRWAGFKPDIITMAKGMGNGFPMAGVATRKEIMDPYKAVFFNTFGGGQLQCLIGMEVLRVIREENLHLNAEKVGGYLLSELGKLKDKYDIIGDVRGAGLMIGLEFVTDKKTHTPSKDIANDMMELTRERQLLFGKGGAYGNTLRIQPPMILTMEDAKYIVDALEDAVISYQKK